MAVRGTEDDVLGGQEQDFFSQLSSQVQNKSLLLTFNASSGGALHDQIGSPLIGDAEYFSFLNKILGGPIVQA